MPTRLTHFYYIYTHYVRKEKTGFSTPKDDQLDVYRVDGNVGAQRVE